MSHSTLSPSYLQHDGPNGENQTICLSRGILRGEGLELRQLKGRQLIQSHKEPSVSVGISPKCGPFCLLSSSPVTDSCCAGDSFIPEVLSVRNMPGIILVVEFHFWQASDWKAVPHITDAMMRMVHDLVKMRRGRSVWWVFYVIMWMQVHQF